MFSILGTIIVGLIVGVLARFLLPGSENLPSGALGVILTIVFGIVGAFIGTFIGQALGFGPRNGETVYAAGWIMSIIGAIVLLLLVRLLFGRRSTTTV
jgi:uncharacterized membrane protein YeaQ/YmgE (transglycosylase-associated protein family)